MEVDEPENEHLNTNIERNSGFDLDLQIEKLSLDNPKKKLGIKSKKKFNCYCLII
jgi:hypothetical protein